MYIYIYIERERETYKRYIPPYEIHVRVRVASTLWPRADWPHGLLGGSVGLKMIWPRGSPPATGAAFEGIIIRITAILINIHAYIYIYIYIHTHLYIYI